MPVDGNAAAVVDHRHRAIDVNGDVDLIAEPGEGLIDGVVDDLVDQMVQARGSGGPDVHGGSLLNRLEPLEHLDLVGRILIDLG